MSESLSVNLFPAICLLLSCIFVVYIQWKFISRALSLCHPRHWCEPWSYDRVRDQEAVAGIEDAIEMNPVHADSNSDAEAASDGDPLAKYFDLQTSVLHEHIHEPPSPPIATWERDLQYHVDNGRGLTALVDRLVDRAVKRAEAVIGRQ